MESRSAAAALCALLSLSGAAGAPRPDASSDSQCVDFAQVSPGLYRGAEPSERCLGHLAASGIRKIVNLRDEEEASEREQAQARTLGMRYVNIPMSGFGRPEADEVRSVLTTIRASENQPVFLHCRHGRDRTGAIVAAYRMAHEGWPAERAVQEAKEFGMAWWQFRMRKFIRTFGANTSLPIPR